MNLMGNSNKLEEEMIQYPALEFEYNALKLESKTKKWTWATIAAGREADRRAGRQSWDGMSGWSTCIRTCMALLANYCS